MTAVGMRLRIHYRNSDDIVSDREISDILVAGPNAVNAYCHSRAETRTFVLDRVEEAVDAESGEVIPDLWLYLGLPSRKPEPLTMPEFAPPSAGISVNELRNQRNADKARLFRIFKSPVITAARKHQLWALFDYRCFRCHLPGKLEMDHHVPQDLGGRLVPGNIVLLCKVCNSLKRTTHPSKFYSRGQLDAVTSLLHAQLKLFDFHFSHIRWSRHPEEYLISLGVSEADAHAAVRRVPAMVDLLTGTSASVIGRYSGPNPTVNRMHWHMPSRSRPAARHAGYLQR